MRDPETVSVPTRIIRDSRLSASELRILLHAIIKEGFRHSINYFVQATGITDKTVRTALTRLVMLGYLTGCPRIGGYVYGKAIDGLDRIQGE